MDALNISGTEDTPEIVLDKGALKFEISGRSLPEDAAGFYQQVIDWMNGYANESNDATEFHVKLEYFNTASSKLLLDVLSILEDIDGATIVWHFPDDDEDMEEAGEEFSELVEAPFELVSYED